MLKPNRFATLALTASAVTLDRADRQRRRPAPAAPAPVAGPRQVELGAYLVKTMGCNDCHTPWKMGPKGPEMDMTRALTGHPQRLVMPPPPALPARPWIGTMRRPTPRGPAPGA